MRTRDPCRSDFGDMAAGCSPSLTNKCMPHEASSTPGSWIEVNTGCDNERNVIDVRSHTPRDVGAGEQIRCNRVSFRKNLC